MNQIKLTSVPYLTRPNRPVKVAIKYTSGNTRYGRLTKENEFYCSQGTDYRGKLIVVFWDKKHRMFSLSQSSAKTYFNLFEKAKPSLERLISKFKHSSIKLYM